MGYFGIETSSWKPGSLIWLSVVSTEERKNLLPLRSILSSTRMTESVKMPAWEREVLGI